MQTQIHAFIDFMFTNILNFEFSKEFFRALFIGKKRSDVNMFEVIMSYCKNIYTLQKKKKNYTVFRINKSPKLQ